MDAAFSPRYRSRLSRSNWGTPPAFCRPCSGRPPRGPAPNVRVRTRSGNQLDQHIRYFSNTGKEVTEAKYRKLLSFQRGDSTVTIIPGADWSPWSLPYTTTGAPITSPSPRRYVMIEATLRSGRSRRGCVAALTAPRTGRAPRQPNSRRDRSQQNGPARTAADFDLDLAARVPRRQQRI